MLRLARTEPLTEVEGPGKRFAIWCQGCTLACEGCCNLEMQSLNGGYLVKIEELVNQIFDSDTDGITLVGGEPLLQAEKLGEFLDELRLRGYNKGIILFSGYTFEEISLDAQKLEVAKRCDLLIAGRFKFGMPERRRRWIGSSNQTVHFFSEVYEYLRESWPVAGREIEIHISDGELSINGFPLGEESDFEKIFQIGEGVL